MPTHVYANGNEIASKAADGKSIAAFPDVCFSPPAPPVGPIPLPYPNTTEAPDTDSGTAKVFIMDKMSGMVDDSHMTKSMGDDAATKNFNKGLITGALQGKCSFGMWSMNVNMEGKSVPRHMDLVAHNHASVTWQIMGLFMSKKCCAAIDERSGGGGGTSREIFLRIQRDSFKPEGQNFYIYTGKCDETLNDGNQIPTDAFYQVVNGTDAAGDDDIKTNATSAFFKQIFSDDLLTLHKTLGFQENTFSKSIFANFAIFDVIIPSDEYRQNATYSIEIEYTHWHTNNKLFKEDNIEITNTILLYEKEGNVFSKAQNKPDNLTNPDKIVFKDFKMTEKIKTFAVVLTPASNSQYRINITVDNIKKCTSPAIQTIKVKWYKYIFEDSLAVSKINTTMKNIDAATLELKKYGIHMIKNNHLEFLHKKVNGNTWCYDSVGFPKKITDCMNTLSSKKAAEDEVLLYKNVVDSFGTSKLNEINDNEALICIVVLNEFYRNHREINSLQNSRNLLYGLYYGDKSDTPQVSSALFLDALMGNDKTRRVFLHELFHSFGLVPPNTSRYYENSISECSDPACVASKTTGSGQSLCQKCRKDLQTLTLNCTNDVFIDGYPKPCILSKKKTGTEPCARCLDLIKYDSEHCYLPVGDELCLMAPTEGGSNLCLRCEQLLTSISFFNRKPDHDALNELKKGTLAPINS